MLSPQPSAPGTSSPAAHPSSSSAATTTAMDNPRAHLLERRHHDPPSPQSYNTIEGSLSSPESPIPAAEDGEMDLSNMSRKSQWIILAIASGACAAFNGVFAKLYVQETILEHYKSNIFCLSAVASISSIHPSCSTHLSFKRASLLFARFQGPSLLTSLRRMGISQHAVRRRLTPDMQDNDGAHDKLRGFNCSAFGAGGRGEGRGGCC
jgi:hypothetical protein